MKPRMHGKCFFSLSVITLCIVLMRNLNNTHNQTACHIHFPLSLSAGIIFCETRLTFWMILLVTPICSEFGSTEFGIWTNRESTAEPLASGSSISNLEMGFNKLALVGLYAAPEGPVPIWKTWIPFCNTMQTRSHPEYKSTVLRQRGRHIHIPKKLQPAVG